MLSWDLFKNCWKETSALDPTSGTKAGGSFVKFSKNEDNKKYKNYHEYVSSETFNALHANMEGRESWWNITTTMNDPALILHSRYSFLKKPHPTQFIFSQSWKITL